MEELESEKEGSADKFPAVLWRGDGSILHFANQFYPEHNEWWIGYFDRVNGGWVQRATTRHADNTTAAKLLEEKMDSLEFVTLYSREKPSSNLGYVYDKSIVE